MLPKCYTQGVSKSGKLSNGHRTGKGVFIPIPKKGNAKECSTQLHSFHMFARLCSKSFKLGFSITLTENSQMYKLDLEKAEEPEIKLPTYVESWRKQGSSRKNIYFCFIDYAKNFEWITTNCEKFLKRWEYQTSYLSPEKPVFRSRSNN